MLTFAHHDTTTIKIYSEMVVPHSLGNVRMRVKGQKQTWQWLCTTRAPKEYPTKLNLFPSPKFQRSVLDKVISPFWDDWLHMVPTYLGKPNSQHFPCALLVFSCVFADKICNFKYKTINNIWKFPVFFHKFSNSLCFSCLGLPFPDFAIFPVQWEHYYISGHMIKSHTWHGTTRPSNIPTKFDLPIFSSWDSAQFC